MIDRPRQLTDVRRALKRSRVVALLGPRQSGKTTLARVLVPVTSSNYFDLEEPRGLSRLAEPMTALERLKGIVVIDEVQHRPDLFPILRVLADRQPLPARFLILGSAGPELLRQSSESLAGRLETVALGGLSLDEVGSGSLVKHWRRGGFPRSFLARSEADSFAWRQQFLRTFVERDVAQFGVSIPPVTLLRFWTMLAHNHGGVWNAAEPARSLGLSAPTIRRYADLFAGLFLIRQLQPWFENLGKRQVKAPKIYIRDSGVLHALLGFRNERDLLSHPKLGLSWEGYVIEQVLSALQPDDAYFWATHTGAELDLLLMHRGRRYGIEVKYQDAPRMTPSMRTAIDELKLESLTVLYPGPKTYALGERVSVLPVEALLLAAARGRGFAMLASGAKR